MLQKTYEKVNHMFEQAGGYLATRTLLDARITTIQIRALVEEGKIERVSHGHYWNLMSGRKKPENYKMLEACMTNSKAVICALSACYYHGLLKEEPEKLYVATRRTDRSGMELAFPVSRHYYSIVTFEEDMVEVDTPSGSFKVYDIDRSVCDCIRMESEIGEEKLSLVLEAYRKYKNKDMDRLFAYADRMRFGRIARQYLDK